MLEPTRRWNSRCVSPPQGPGAHDPENQLESVVSVVPIHVQAETKCQHSCVRPVRGVGDGPRRILRREHGLTEGVGDCMASLAPGKPVHDGIRPALSRVREPHGGAVGVEAIVVRDGVVFPADTHGPEPLVRRVFHAGLPVRGGGLDRARAQAPGGEAGAKRYPHDVRRRAGGAPGQARPEGQENCTRH